MNRSIGFRAQSSRLTAGTAGRRGGRNAQCVALLRRFVGRGRCSLVDPGPQESDLGLGQRRAIERHAFGGSFTEYGRQKRTLLGLSRNDGRPFLAPLSRRRRRVQPQPATRLLGPVAGDAVPGQQRLDGTQVINLWRVVGAGWRITGGRSVPGPRVRGDDHQQDRGQRAVLALGCLAFS